MALERIQKLISQAGVASRRRAEELIQAGKVTVNGQKAILGSKASFDDQIIVDGIPLTKAQGLYLMLNKPERVVTTVSDPQGRTTVLNLINIPEKIFPIGRLDYDAAGTLLLTNDGEMAHRLMHPSFGIKRVYRVRTDEPLGDEGLSFLNSHNVRLDGVISEQTVVKDDNKTYIVTLNVGTYHHVKRLFELVDRKVLHLTRIEFAGLSHVGNLNKGEWRMLKPKEVKWLKTLTSSASEE